VGTRYGDEYSSPGGKNINVSKTKQKWMGGLILQESWGVTNTFEGGKAKNRLSCVNKIIRMHEFLGILKRKLGANCKQGGICLKKLSLLGKTGFEQCLGLQ